MIDEWVEDLRSGECWRLDNDNNRPVYRTRSGELRFRDGFGTISRFKFWPCCPKTEPVRTDIPETGKQFSIFDFMEGQESQGDEEEREKPADPLEEERKKYEARGYRPRIAEALARKELGMENPDAFLLDKFKITGEPK